MEVHSRFCSIPAGFKTESFKENERKTVLNHTTNEQLRIASAKSLRTTYNFKRAIEFIRKSRSEITPSDDEQELNFMCERYKFCFG